MRLSRSGIIFLEIAGIAIAVLAVLAAIFFWRLQSGPVSLALFKPSAELAIERMIPGAAEVQIGAVSLARNRGSLARNSGGGGYDLVLSDILINGEDGMRIAHLAGIEVNFLASGILRGQAGPRRIIATEPTLHFVRRRDASIDLGPGGQSPSGGGAGGGDLFKLLTGGKYFRGAFEKAELRRARIEFHDEASGVAWEAKQSYAIIERRKDGYAAKVDGSFLIEGKPASLALDAFYSERADEIDATLKIVSAPVGDILEMFFGPPANVLSGPVTGEAKLKLTGGGQPISSTIVGKAGKGKIALAGVSAEIDFVDFAIRFDPDANKFTIEKLRYGGEFGSGDITGDVALVLAEESRIPREILFDIVAGGVELILPAWLQEPVSIDAFRGAGGYALATRRLTLDAVSAALVGVNISGAAAIEAPRPRNDGDDDDGDGAAISPAISATLKVDGAVDPQRILKLWPITVGLGARDFVRDRIPAGFADNIALEMDLKAGAVGEIGRLPEDAMTLSFEVRDATAIYAPGMTPLTGVSGKAVMKGNSFLLLADRGNVGDIPVTDGKVDMPALVPKGQLSYFSFTARGKARSILTVLDQEPLAILQHTKLNPSQFSGDGELRVTVSRPNRREVPREKYGYDGTATFTDLAIEDFYGDISLTHAAGGVVLSTDAMTINADAQIEGAPVKLDWRQRFYGKGDKTRIRVSGVADSATGDVMGVQTRQMLRGPVSFDAEAIGNLGALRRFSVNTDFTEAALTFDLIGWRKPQGSPAIGRFEIDLMETGPDIGLIELTGDGVSVSGSARLGPGGRIELAKFERLAFAGAADLALDAKRTAQGALDLTITGDYLNISPLLERFFENAGGGQAGAIDWGAGILLTSRITQLGLRKGVVYNDTSFDMRRGAERLQTLDFSAIAESGEPVSMTLKLTGDDAGPAQIVEARTDDIGALVKGVFGLESVSGGQGVLEILTSPAKDGVARDHQGIDGKLEARNIRVRGASLLARIFAAGSLGGLSDLLNGEGIELARAFADFTFSDGVFTLRDGHAVGPSVGLSAVGEVALGEAGGISLNGAVAPAYQVNSLLGKTPLVGDIFVSREGEGVVALAYDVSGPVSAPTVTINPFSAFTPGVLRRIFEIEPRTEDSVEGPEAAPAEIEDNRMNPP